MKEMKSKIMTEFKKREALTGMGKMKWDAQVRLRQAKIRASGQSASRADVVMIMMEELINKSRQDIEVRFLKIEGKEDFKGIDFGERVIIEDEPAKVIDVAALFGMVSKPAVADTSVLPDTIRYSPVYTILYHIIILFPWRLIRFTVPHVPTITPSPLGRTRAAITTVFESMPSGR